MVGKATHERKIRRLEAKVFKLEEKIKTLELKLQDALHEGGCSARKTEQAEKLFLDLQKKVEDVLVILNTSLEVNYPHPSKTCGECGTMSYVGPRLIDKDERFLTLVRNRLAKAIGTDEVTSYIA